MDHSVFDMIYQACTLKFCRLSMNLLKWILKYSNMLEEQLFSKT